MLDWGEQWHYMPAYLGGHLQLTFAALAGGVAISVPLGLLVSRVPFLRPPTLAAVAAIQTIPGLALLAFMVLAFGFIGFLPAIIALTLYSMLPIVRNTVTGLAEVDPGVLEAARGIGMTPRQILLKVQVPLALPIMVAGIRTAAVWTVGLATLATPVGATSLGNYIFSGLQTMNEAALILGTVAAAILALLLDGVIGLVEYGFRKRKLWALAAALVPLAALVAAAFYVPGPRTQYVVGAKNFTEQYILAEVMKAQLEADGLTVSSRENLGSTVAFEALANNRIDCYIDYTGTIWFNYMNRTDNPGAEAMREQTAQWLEAERGVRLLGPIGFENAYAFAMPREKAESLGIATISDLAVHAADLALGSDYEFFERPEWARVRDAYGLQFREQRTFDPTLMYPAVVQGDVDLITAFTTDGRILAYDLVVLEDPRGAFPPYDAVLLLSPEAADDEELIDALAPLVGAIDSDTMRRANKEVDVDGGAVSSAARGLRDLLGH